MNLWFQDLSSKRKRQYAAKPTQMNLEKTKKYVTKKMRMKIVHRICIRAIYLLVIKGEINT